MANSKENSENLIDVPGKQNLPNQQEEKIVVTRRGVELEYNFLTIVYSNEELDDLRFEHNCDYGLVKKRPNFETVTMRCIYRQRKQKCQYSLIAKRLELNSRKIWVYAYSEHNHPVKPIEIRSVHRFDKSLIADDELPKIEIQIGPRKWNFQRIVDNFQHLDQARLENHCTTMGKHWSQEAFQITIIYTANNTCPFLMLARKTTRGRYHVYTYEEHNHSFKTNEDGRKKKKRRLDGQDRSEEMDQAVTEEEHQLKEFTAEKICKGLRRALLEGKGRRVEKWVGRTGKGQMGEVLNGMDGMEVILLLEYFKKVEEEGNEESLSYGLSNWLCWVEVILKHRGVEIFETPELVDRLTVFSHWLNSIKLPNEAEEQGNGQIEEKREYPVDKLQRRIEKAILEGKEWRVRKWMRRTGREQIGNLMAGLDKQNGDIVIDKLIGEVGDGLGSRWTFAWIGVVLGRRRFRKMVGSERELALWELLDGQIQSEVVLLRSKLRLNKLLKKKSQRKRKLEAELDLGVDKKRRI